MNDTTLSVVNATPKKSNGKSAKESTTAATRTVFNLAQIAVLTQKSPKELIRTRVGASGKTLSYLPHNFVTELLNQAFNFAWSFSGNGAKLTYLVPLGPNGEEYYLPIGPEGFVH